MKLSDFIVSGLGKTSLALGVVGNISTEANSKVYGICSFGANCGGGGGQCSFGANCSGGGGVCSFGANCGGGGGMCSFGANCSGS